MKITKYQLKPYKSFLLCRAGPKIKTKDMVRDLRDYLREELDSRDHVDEVVNGGNVTETDGVFLAFFHYVEHRQCSWTTNSDVFDIIHHEVVVCGHKHFFAVQSSDSAIRQWLLKQIQDGEEPPCEGLTLPPIGVMNAAFARGQTVTLWLSGTHRRNVSKADNKIVSGLDLRYALDPLADQSFFYTAIRSSIPTGDFAKQAIGLSPRKAGVWLGASKDWADFSKTAGILMRAAANVATKVSNPLPILATPIDAGMSPKLGEVYDAAFIPPEFLDAQASEDERILADKWSAARFDIQKSSGTQIEFRLVILHGGAERLVGDFDIKLEISKPTAVKWAVTAKPADKGDETQANAKEALEILRRRRSWLKLWFESGHVLADCGIYEQRFRDVRFPMDGASARGGWLWHDFKDFAVKQEKPDPLTANNIGKQKSLFCWMQKHWMPHDEKSNYAGGWLASNDGSMEIADFIHLNDAATMPVLSLVHVKGAHSDSPGRKVAISPYEVVVGQAVKNIRHLDHELLEGNFNERLDRRIREAVWRNRKKATDRKGMLKAIAALGSNYQRRVIVVQPHVTKTTLQKAYDAKPDAAQHHLAKQLDTLLVAAAANCHAVGAEFYVIGDAG